MTGKLLSAFVVLLIIVLALQYMKPRGEESMCGCAGYVETFNGDIWSPYGSGRCPSKKPKIPAYLQGRKVC